MSNLRLSSSEMEAFVDMSEAHRETLNKIILSAWFKENDMQEMADEIRETYFNFITPQKDVLYALFHTHYKDGHIEDILVPKDFCVREYFHNYSLINSEGNLK